MSAGARFFDEKNNELGWAADVEERVHLLGSLTVLDIKGPDAALAEILACLDHKGLVVKRAAEASPAAYRFKWASGYRNGTGVRLRGMLVPTG